MLAVQECKLLIEGFTHNKEVTYHVPTINLIILLLNMLEFNRKHAYMDEVQAEMSIFIVTAVN
jgi:hypothetical protein